MIFETLRNPETKLIFNPKTETGDNLQFSFLDIDIIIEIKTQLYKRFISR